MINKKHMEDLEAKLDGKVSADALLVELFRQRVAIGDFILS